MVQNAIFNLENDFGMLLRAECRSEGEPNLKIVFDEHY